MKLGHLRVLVAAGGLCLGAAVGGSAVGAAQPAPSAAPPVFLRGVISGPGFVPGVRTWVYATLNDEEDYPTRNSFTRQALSHEVHPSPDGAFVLPIPAEALVPEASKHQGWVNLFLNVGNVNGASVIYSVPLKQVSQGGFSVDRLNDPLNTALNITLPKVPAVLAGTPRGSQTATTAICPTGPPAAGNVIITTLINTVCGAPAPTPGPGACGQTTSTQFAVNGFPTEIAEIHSHAGGDDTYPWGINYPEYVTFRYWNNASSQIDTGFGESGSVGIGPVSVDQWSISGMVTINNDKGTAITYSTDPAKTEGWVMEPVFTYKEWQDTQTCAGQTAYSTFRVDPVNCCSGFDFGADLSGLDSSTEYGEHYFDPGKLGYGVRQTWTKNVGQTARYSLAANAFGFQVGSESIWGNGLEDDYGFGTGQAGDPRQKVYWLWPENHEDSLYDAAAINAYTWANANIDPGPAGTTNGHPFGGGLSPVGPQCYGGVCTTPL